LATAVVLLALLVAVTLYGSGKSQGELRAQSAQAIQQTVERSALQCYVVEGVYPPSLSYLEENYGLQINTKDFYVTYDAFASNLPPTVRVVAKE
jgi:type II secretory pathway pseudopilin PulG